MHTSPSTPSPSSCGLHFNGMKGRAGGLGKVRSRVMGEAASDDMAQRQQISSRPEQQLLDAEILHWCEGALDQLEAEIEELDKTPPSGRKNGFDREFDALQTDSSRNTIQEGPAAATSAMRGSNRFKNRYWDVLPFEDCRVVLKGARHSPPSGSDYINASHIEYDADCALPRFIASQGPLESTVADFWDMARQENCAAIISLTRNVEGSRVKCAHYFPLNQGEVEVYGHLTVRNITTRLVQPHIIERLLDVTENGSSRPPYKAPHYQYLEWPDHGVPVSTVTIRGLIRLLRNSSVSMGPFLVHCSAGIGRTGTYCTIDHTVRRLLACDSSALDIAATVRHFREQRAGMVQTKEQFRFCYLAIRDELREIIAAGTLR